MDEIITALNIGIETHISFHSDFGGIISGQRFCQSGSEALEREAKICFFSVIDSN